MPFLYFFQVLVNENFVQGFIVGPYYYATDIYIWVLLNSYSFTITSLIHAPKLKGFLLLEK